MKTLDLLSVICAFGLITIGLAQMFLTDFEPTPIEWVILGVLLYIAWRVDD